MYKYIILKSHIKFIFLLEYIYVCVFCIINIVLFVPMVTIIFLFAIVKFITNTIELSNLAILPYTLLCFGESKSTSLHNMDDGIRITMIPLSICCILLGYDVSNVKNTKAKNVISWYCCVITTVSFLIWTVLIVDKLSNVTSTFPSVLYLLLDITLITVTTSYRLKCFTSKTSISDIIDYIRCADEYLASVQVDVPHKENLFVSTAFTVLIVFYDAIMTFSLFKPLSIKATQQWCRLAAVSQPLAFILFRITTFYSGVIYLSQFCFLLYTVKQRLSIVRGALNRIQDVDEQYTESSNHVFVLDLRSRGQEERQKYCNNLEAAFRCTYTAYIVIQNFYTDFFCLHVLAYVFSTVIGLYSFITVKDILSYLPLYLYYIFLNVTPVSICVSINFEFKKMLTLINKFYWQTGHTFLHNRQSNGKIWFYQNAYGTQIFDCGYFIVDLALLMLLFDFTSLFVFSTLS